MPTCWPWLAALLLAVPGLPAPVHADTPRDHVLVLARVSDSPERDHAGLEPIVRWAAAHMKDLGVERGEVLFARSNDEMLAFLREGRVDWVTEGPASAVRLAREGGARILLRRWKDGVAEYRPLIVARDAGPVKGLADLVGRKVAFQDPGSTTGCLLPLAMMTGAGLHPVELSSPSATVPPGSVGYVFAGSDLNVVAWTRRGLTDAGAASDTIWASDEVVPRSLKAGLHVVVQGPAVPRTLELVRTGLSAARQERLRTLLLGAHADPEAASALAAYGGTTRFDEPSRTVLEELAAALLGKAAPARPR